jgi:hypothetical protein
MDPILTDTIDKHGDPLAFKLRQGAGRSLLLAARGRDVIKVEARQMAGHQKEAIVAEGTAASAWRLTSDEGKHLRGTDLAPFPLGFFNAGMQSDLYGRMRTLAATRDVALDSVAIRVANHYWLTGSFIHGTGEGHAEAPDIDVRVQSSASTEIIRDLVAAAMEAHRQSHCCARHSPATRSPFTSMVGGGRSKASPTLGTPMPAIPIGSMRARRARSTPTRAAT